MASGIIYDHNFKNKMKKRVMKAFRTQFVDCRKQGLVKPGETKSFKDHPELLPASLSKAAKNIANVLKKNPDAGLIPMKCLRFGGDCSSKNKKCRKMRGFITGD